MKKTWLSTYGRFVALACVASFVVLVATDSVRAQGQGAYISQAANRLGKVVDKGNQDGFSLQSNLFSSGGGWLKKSDKWVALYTVQLNAGTTYRFLASGDNDAQDVDLRITDLKGEKELKADTGTAADAIVEFTPNTTGRYLVQIRLYASRENLDAFCLSVVMQKDK